MAADSIANQLIRSLYFGVEAIPKHDTVQVKSSANMTPLNVKVRVRKKNEAGFVQRGVISIPKYGQPDSSPERVRLVSSDQTIMSFDVLMEADLERRPRKPRKHFFGGCLGTQGDDDDSPYMPSSYDNTSTSTSANVKIHNKLPFSKSNYNDMVSSRQIKKNQKDFFGKCKPGGCLDPPFGEDKYSYKPTTQQKTDFPQTDFKLLRHFNENDVSEKEKFPDPSKLKMLNNVSNLSETQNPTECGKFSNKDDELSDKKNIKLLKRRKRSDSSSFFKAKKEQPDSSVLNLYQAESTTKSLDDNDSNSIITYPPATSSCGLHIDDDPNEKNTRRKSSSTSKSKKSFEFSPAYFIPPKIAIGKDTSSHKEKQDKYHKDQNSKDKIIPEIYSSRKISIKEDPVRVVDQLLTQNSSKENLTQNSQKSSRIYMNKDIYIETDSKTKLSTIQPLYSDKSAKFPVKTDANQNEYEIEGGMRSFDSGKVTKLRSDLRFETINKPKERQSPERPSYGDKSANLAVKTDTNDNNDETDSGMRPSDSGKVTKLRSDLRFEPIKKPKERQSPERPSYGDKSANLAVDTDAYDNNNEIQGGMRPSDSGKVTKLRSDLDSEIIIKPKERGSLERPLYADKSSNLAVKTDANDGNDEIQGGMRPSDTRKVTKLRRYLDSEIIKKPKERESLERTLYGDKSSNLAVKTDANDGNDEIQGGMRPSDTRKVTKLRRYLDSEIIKKPKERESLERPLYGDKSAKLAVKTDEYDNNDEIEGEMRPSDSGKVTNLRSDLHFEPIKTPKESGSHERPLYEDKSSNLVVKTDANDGNDEIQSGIRPSDSGKVTKLRSDLDSEIIKIPKERRSLERPLFGDESANLAVKTDTNDNNDEIQGSMYQSDSEKNTKLRNDVPFEAIKNPKERDSHERQSSIILKKSPYVVSDKANIRDDDVIALSKRSLLPVDITIEQGLDSYINNEKSALRINIKGHPTSSDGSMTLEDDVIAVPFESDAPFADSIVSDVLKFDEDSSEVNIDVPYEIIKKENVDVSKHTNEIKDSFNSNLEVALKGHIDSTRQSLNRSSHRVHILSTAINDDMITANNDIKTSFSEIAPFDPQSQNVGVNTGHEYVNQVTEQKFNNTKHVLSSSIIDNVTDSNEFVLSDDKVHDFDRNIKIKTHDRSRNSLNSNRYNPDNTINGEVNSQALGLRIENEELAVESHIMKTIENVNQKESRTIQQWVNNGNATDVSSIEHEFDIMAIPLDENGKSILRGGNKASVSNTSLNKDYISLNLAFHSFVNDKNEKVVKTLDTTSNIKGNDNIVMIKTLIRPDSREIRVPIDSENDMFIQIQRVVSDHSKTIPKVIFDETSTMKSKHFESATGALCLTDEDEGNIVSNKRIGSQILHGTLSSIYEQELVPLQNFIKGLREDVEALAEDQVLVRDKLQASKKLRSVSSYRRCGCHKK